MASIASWIKHPIVRLATTVLCLWWLSRGVHISRAMDILLHVSVVWVSLAVVLTAAVVGAGVYLWGTLLHAGGHKIPWSKLTSLYLQGLFWAHVLPGGVGGDAVRTVRVAKITGEGPALAAIAASRLVEGLGPVLLSMVAVALLRYKIGPLAFASVGALLGLIGIGWFLLFHAGSLANWLAGGKSRWRQRAYEITSAFVAAMDCYRKKPSQLLKCATVAVIGWSINLAALVCFAHAVGTDVSWSVFALGLPLSLISVVAPFAVNGIGLREGIMVAVLVHFGVPTNHALAIAILTDLQLVPFMLLGAVCWLADSGRQKP